MRKRRKRRKGKKKGENKIVVFKNLLPIARK
jgi:hypothetical protein